eukprot:g32237.t1
MDFSRHVPNALARHVLNFGLACLCVSGGFFGQIESYSRRQRVCVSMRVYAVFPPAPPKSYQLGNPTLVNHTALTLNLVNPSQFFCKVF